MAEILSMPREEYDRLDRVNFSTLKHLRRSPAHYRAALLKAPADTDAMKRGRVTHLAVFEPGRYRAETIVYPERRAGKDWDAFRAKHRGMEILTIDMHEEAQAIGEAARADKTAARYLAKGQAEQTILWDHERPLMPMRGRIDFVTEDALVDLKTCRNASPRQFESQSGQLGYHVQAALYCDGYAAITGKRLPYVIVAVEAAEPHIVQCYEIQEDVLDQGREEYAELLRVLAECRESNHWPGYSDGCLRLELPRWMQPEEDEDVTGLGLVLNQTEAA